MVVSRIGSRSTNCSLNRHNVVTGNIPRRRVARIRNPARPSAIKDQIARVQGSGTSGVVSAADVVQPLARLPKSPVKLPVKLIPAAFRFTPSIGVKIEANAPVLSLLNRNWKRDVVEPVCREP